MKSITTLLFSLIVLIVIFGSLSSCKAAPAEQRPLVITSIHPYELILSELLSPEIEVRSLIPPNASPHTWSAKPSDLTDLEHASLILTNGLGLENSIQSSLERYTVKHISVEELMAIDAYEHDFPEGHEVENDEHQHEGPDPHLWTSMINMYSFIDYILPALTGQFPEYAELITTRADLLKKDLSELQQQINEEAKAFEGMGIITYHNSFGMLLAELGMEVLATVQSSPGTEPSVREMSALGDTIRRHKVKAIFVEPQMSRRSAEVLATEFNLEILQLDPLGSSLNATRITDFFRLNWNEIKKAFPTPQS